jgi:hypothetical protein
MNAMAIRKTSHEGCLCIFRDDDGTDGKCKMAEDRLCPLNEPMSGVIAVARIAKSSGQIQLSV